MFNLNSKGGRNVPRPQSCRVGWAEECYFLERGDLQRNNISLESNEVFNTRNIS